MTQVLHTAERNPVVRAEFHYQRFVIARGRVGGLWILLAALLMIPALLLSIGLVVVGLAALVYPPALDIIPIVSETQANPFIFVLAILLTMMIAMSLVVTFINMALAANSIRREKEGNTWDTLRLTDVGAERIVLGKWWASLRALNGDYVMSTVIRMGFVTFFFASIAPILDAFRQAEVRNAVVIMRSVDFLQPLPLFLLLVLIYSALDAALTAALGVFSALPDEATGAVASSAALLVRLATLVGAALWMYVSLEMAATAGVLMGAIGIVVYIFLIAAVLLVARRSVG